MRRCDRAGVKVPQLEWWDAAALQLGCAQPCDVLWRSLFTVRGYHEVTMAHLRERVALPGGVVR